MSNICRVSGDPLELVVDFGRQPLGNGFLNQEDFKNEYFLICNVVLMKK